jgi:endo-1,4-beta-mannosidase
MPEPFVLGVNYWPRRKAMYWWSQFDPGEVREEFALIRELGLDMVRIFLLWDDFQPAPDQVSRACLDHLITVAEIAAALGLKLDVTFFTGHMSGPNWAPGWLLDGRPRRLARQLVSSGRVVQRGYRNPYADEQALQAERLLLRTVVGALYDHPAIAIWNLGNEPDLFAWPPNAAAGRAWVREMTQLIHGLDSRHPVTCGLHVANLLQDNGLRVTEVFAETDVAVMHAYPMYGWVARSPLDPDFVPFTCALTTALCGKPVLMEEFGGPTAPPGRGSYMWRWLANRFPRIQFMAGEEAMAEYLAGVLPRLVSVGATGALLWCFADYAADLWDRPPLDLARHERFFGLVRPDGTLKPHAQVLKNFAATKPMMQKPAREVKLPFLPARFYNAAGRNLFRLYRAFAQ